MNDEFARRLPLAGAALAAALALASPGVRSARAGDAAPVSSASPVVPKDAWALIGSSAVTREDVERRRRLLGVLAGEADLPVKLVIDGLVTERIVSDHLDRAGMGPASVSAPDLAAARSDLEKMLRAPAAEVAKKLKDQGLDGEIELLLRVSAALKKRVERDATDDALKAEFEKRKLLLCDGQIRAREVVVAVKEGDAQALARAQQVISAVKPDGSNFEAIARKVSDDPMAPLTGGDKDFFGANPAEWRAVRPEVIRATFEQGAVGLVPQAIKCRDGYHVVYVTEVRILGDATEAAHHEIVRNLFLSEHSQALMKSWRDETKVTLAPDAPR